MATNVRALRGRLPVREMSERLRAIGRPILPSGITKVEQGTRRVDVDDLVALALVLDVTPNRLLLAGDKSTLDETRIELTPNFGALSGWTAWAWACGDAPIDHSAAGDDVGAPEYFEGGYIDRRERFVKTNRPHDATGLADLGELVPHTQRLQALAAVLDEHLDELEREGVPRKAALRWLEIYRSEGRDDG